MILVALDSTSRAGSLALWRDGRLAAVRPGDPAVGHSARLPGDLLALLAGQGLGLADVTHFALAVGPGSLTGLRVGMATIQGLAFARGIPVVGVSALDALALAGVSAVQRPPDFVAGWKDALRREVFTALYRVGPPGAALSSDALGLVEVEPPWVGSPEAARDRWPRLVAGHRVVVAGDTLPPAEWWTPLGAEVEPVQPDALAPAVARIGAHRAARGEAGPPHALQPLYVRRPDAEVARERRDAATRPR